MACIRSENGKYVFIDRFATAPVEEAPALLRDVLEFLASLPGLRLEAAREHPHQAVVERVKRLLESDAADRSDLARIAEEVGVSYSLLRKAFHDATGHSLIHYRTRVRMQRARLLLDRHSVREVAERLGYGDPFAFSKQFKRIVGVSPKQFQMLYYRS
ncbi:MAG: helix-turn-helix transcriptional regulator [Candidatus Sumerlaeia bacterium]